MRLIVGMLKYQCLVETRVDFCPGEFAINDAVLLHEPIHYIASSRFVVEFDNKWDLSFLSFFFFLLARASSWTCNLFTLFLVQNHNILVQQILQYTKSNIYCG